MSTELASITKTEQGWPGHFVLGHRCIFHRNTLLTKVSRVNSVTQIIVSTVGNMQPPEGKEDDGLYRQIGHNRYYETMVFYATFEDPYWHVDVQRQIDLWGPCSISTCEREDDLKANAMHEAAVVEIEGRLLQGSV